VFLSLPFARPVLVNNNPKYTQNEVKMFDSEVHSVMNPSPKLAGPTGSDSLDLMLSSAESSYERARKRALEIKPLIEQGEKDGDFFMQAIGLASGEQKNANGFLQSATQYLEGRQARAKKTFADNNPRPKNVSSDLIVARMHTLEILLDSLKSKDIMLRLQTELKEGDEVSRYILRGGERWIGAYLESRQLKELDLIYYIRQNAGILESDLMKACDELLTLPPLFEKLQSTKKAIENGFLDLAIKIMDWTKPAPFHTNSALADSAPVTMGTLRQEIRKLNQSRGSGFFNQNL
jgi:hypothetical protein